MDDVDILGELRAGRTPPWGEIYARYRIPMYRAAIRVLGSAEATVNGKGADDVVQLVFRELMRKGLPSDVHNLEGLLCQRVRLRAIDALRGARRDQALPDDDGDAARDPEAEAIARCVLDEASTVILTLTDNEQYVIRERLMHERPAKDVAAEIGVTPQYLPKLIRGALDKIRDTLGFTAGQSDDQETPRSSTTRADQEVHRD